MTKLNEKYPVIAAILEQLGGNRFAAMTGAKGTIINETTIKFKIGRNATSGNTFLVEYDAGKDLYKLMLTKDSFSYKTLEAKRKIIKELDEVYAEDMTRIFTEWTGLYTRLG